ncbi:MAG: hypothetical protein KDC49_00850 [Saprospiraceae bacterium]|nr:hypothetical protein [Saprospiraceae bacterium]
MTSSNTDLKKYWLYFFVSVLATIAFLIFKPEWFWVMLPFVFTYFVQAKNWL